MDCIVCYENAEDMYVVNCGSKVDHAMCQDCADEWRSKMPITPSGRIMTCPSCRQPEPASNERSNESLQKELAEVYLLLAQPQPPRAWCQSGQLERGTCFTQTKTSRVCTMAGCHRRVCRACRMCLEHFDF